MKMTLQQAFNAAYIGVLAQGCKSTNEEGNCLYNDGKGNKCGIGHTMPEGTDVTECNRMGAVQLADVGHPSVEHLSEISRRDIDQLQGCHDFAVAGKTFIVEFTANMERLAILRGLTIPPTN